MLRALLVGATAGPRSITPLAIVATAAARGELPQDHGAPKLLAHPLVASAITALAAGELAGDKMKTAPDRIIWPGMIARTATGAIAAMAVSPKSKRVTAALIGGVAAAVVSHLSFRARMGAMGRYGQTATGVVEDLINFAASAAIVRGAKASA
jgi:uncharacterized membrane protein